MAEELVIPETATKQERYDALLPQIESLVAGEPDVVANLSNIAATLKQAMNFSGLDFIS